MTLTCSLLFFIAEHLEQCAVVKLFSVREIAVEKVVILKQLTRSCSIENTSLQMIFIWLQ